MNQNQNGEKNIYASAFVMVQNSNFENLFEPDEALCRGTIFPELFLPKLGMEEFYER